MPRRAMDALAREDRAAALDRLERLARLLDDAVTVPGTSIRFGLDAVLGLVPGVGDAVSAVLSGYLIAEAHRLGAPNGLVLRMIANVGFDTLLGAVPALGDVFDVFWRANRRNLDLLRRHLAAHDPTVIEGEATRLD